METNTPVVDYAKARKLKIKDYENNPVLSTEIPQIVEGIFYSEFGINLPDAKETIPIVFEIGWRKICEFVATQPVDEFSIDICGVSFEYTTEITDAEKSTNIVPHLVHTRKAVFKTNDHPVIAGSDYKSAIIDRYNNWRTVNLQETISAIENKVYADLIKEYGIDLTISAAVFPLLAAIYTAGVQKARDICRNANYDPSAYLELYNVMAIKVDEDETVLLRPLRSLKEGVKSDAKIGELVSGSSENS
jgi:hypothetical protein